MLKEKCKTLILFGKFSFLDCLTIFCVFSDFYGIRSDEDGAIIDPKIERQFIRRHHLNRVSYHMIHMFVVIEYTAPKLIAH